jgi:hypothetical protein
MTEVRLQVGGFPDSDAEERAELTWSLEEEVRQLDVQQISRPAMPAPDGAKGGALEWAQLVLELVGTLPPLFSAVLAWTHRHPGAAVTLEIDGDRLTIDHATATERSALVDAWLERHGTARG